jgi:hypothetical protein
MISITLPGVDRDEVGSTTPMDAIIDGFRNALRIHRERRAILKLSRLSPHMLRTSGSIPGSCAQRGATSGRSSIEPAIAGAAS